MSESALAAAREMTREAYAERLREIEMSQEQSETWESVKTRVADHVNDMGQVFADAERRSAERTWIRHQTSGEIVSKLIVPCCVTSLRSNWPSVYMYIYPQTYSHRDAQCH